ncbi:hypothetical protein NHF46_10090 [Arthrobacter alpinus]|nr:hypothetical protein [Arthrobacter alpinus]
MALLWLERNEKVRQGIEILYFEAFIGVHGDVRLTRDVARLAQHIAIAEGDSDSWVRGIADSLEKNFHAYKSIREAIEAASGSAQASMARALGLSNSYFAQLASNLCDVGVIVAANRNGRVYLWSANDTAAPAEAERRPTSFMTSPLPELEDSVLAGEEWERIRLNFEASVLEANEQPESSFSFLDIVSSRSALRLHETRGAPVMLDGEDNAIGYGHLDPFIFHSTVLPHYLDYAARPAKSWQKNMARHTWMALEGRDAEGGAILREVDEEHPGSQPVTVITTRNRNTDPARFRNGRHVWLPDGPALNERSEGILGSEAVKTLINSGIAPDVSFPRWHQREWHTELRFGKALESGEIPWKLEDVEPKRDSYSEEIVQAWILGPDSTTAISDAEAAQSAGEIWSPHPELCLISRTGARLRFESSLVAGRDGGLNGKGGWRYAWIEVPALETITCGVKESLVTSLSGLVAERINVG